MRSSFGSSILKKNNYVVSLNELYILYIYCMIYERPYYNVYEYLNALYFISISTSLSHVIIHAVKWRESLTDRTCIWWDHSADCSTRSVITMLFQLMCSHEIIRTDCVVRSSVAYPLWKLKALLGRWFPFTWHSNQKGDWFVIVGALSTTKHKTDRNIILCWKLAYKLGERTWHFSGLQFELKDK